jgi:hypothetical protein
VLLSGKDSNAYSFFPAEGEIGKASPNHRFFVFSDPYEEDGFTMIDLMQQQGSSPRAGS